MYSFERQLEYLLYAAISLTEESRLEIAMYTFVALVDFLESGEPSDGQRRSLQTFLENTSFGGGDLDDWLEELRRNWGTGEDFPED